jgi:hypothetical protein
MKPTIFYLILIGSIYSGISNGQTSVNDSPIILEDLYHRMLNNYGDNVRLEINDSIRFIIDSYVKSDTLFSHRFENLRYLGQITSSDSLIKIITWNLVLKNGQSRYFCYLIRKQEGGKPNKIYRLETIYNENKVKTDTTYSEQNWYGALYYDIKPYVIDNNRLWVILGIDYGDPLITRKIIDVLSFNKQDSIIFGEKWFDSGAKRKFRDVLEYSSSGIMSLKFTSDSSIVFDHLVPFEPNLKDNRQFYGPDYSYDAYYLKNGIWKLTTNVDARNKD